VKELSRLGYHGSRPSAESLKLRGEGERGSKVFLDERTGTIAMTIYGNRGCSNRNFFVQVEARKSGWCRSASFGKAEARRRGASPNGLTQQVKHYQCRETEVVKPDSWLRSKLKQIG
jgi:hypothetical protein